MTADRSSVEPALRTNGNATTAGTATSRRGFGLAAVEEDRNHTAPPSRFPRAGPDSAIADRSFAARLSCRGGA